MINQKIFTKPKPKETTREVYESITKHPILLKLPRFTHKYAAGFLERPISNGIAFTILHEASAIIPLLGLWYLFHKFPGLVPVEIPGWAIEKVDKLIEDNFQHFEFSGSEDKLHFAMEGALAYIITKFLLPLRVVFSLWGMNWVSRWFVYPFYNAYQHYIVNRGKEPKKKGEFQYEIKKQETKELKKPRL